jgi:glutamate synthase domain-containing protein 2/glutamate synthase domain-containing protein 1/glutamate synthase domain-containing protein 3
MTLRAHDPDPLHPLQHLAVRTLYRPEHEHDACGTGFVANINGRREHDVLATALTCVRNLTHRGALLDAETGDGAGVLTQVPAGLLRAAVEAAGHTLNRDSDLGVGMIFLPKDGEGRQAGRAIVEAAIQRQGLKLFGWRDVPVDSSVLGQNAVSSEPQIAQVLVGRPERGTDDEYERRLFLARKEIEREGLAQGLRLYVPSMSHRTLVYKGLLVAHQLPLYYPDLNDPRYETALAIFHQRYSTNTMPSWELSQPFRMLAHNGEINTLAANKNWTAARRPELNAPDAWGARIEQLQPMIQPGGSDTAALDNVLETLALSGRDVRHALMMLVPEAWENMPNMSEARRAFYEYHACITEPWDGPASLTFSDGTIVGACLDRNGLRPSRYIVTDDGRVVAGSEVGMVEIPTESIVEKGRLGPGQMIAVDTQHGWLLKNDEIKDEFASKRPYRQWIQRQLLPLDGHLQRRPLDAPPGAPLDLGRLQLAFNYTQEELQFILKPMAGEGKEPVGSMGDDTALAVLASTPRLLYAYFKQKFAQVTNPPIDPIREELVMSLDTYLGWRRNLLGETEAHARLLHLKSPLMIDEEMEALRRIAEPAFHAVTISCLMDAPGSEARAATQNGAHAGHVAHRSELDAALRAICDAAVRAVDQGATIIVLSDRGVDAQRAPVPMLLAVGAVHHHLIREGRRMRCSIIAETAEARDVHQIACLIGFGASAVNPYLAFAVLADAAESGDLKELNAAITREVGDDRVADLKASGEFQHRVRERAFANYETAVDAGLLKIISKMGISTITGYHAAQIFEAIGLSQDVLDRCFTGLISRVGGIGLTEIANETLGRHARAFDGSLGRLDDGAFYRYRRDGEYHAYNPDIIKSMHKAVESGDFADYREYAELVQSRPPTTLRDLIRFKPLAPAIDVSEVEPEESIMRRFATSAMSLGALSPEAHETMAIGINRIGGKSNTGEGGEDSRRFQPMPNGDSSNSKIKQVASARFGVTAAYLTSAEEIEIKMAQGSKPGEGGQLPAFKVSAMIAALRHTLPGTPLISPPPHHDIYSIEDLAQLIYDLKMVNPRARVAVKLVAEEGVGTIAAGVAKGYADVIHISGHDGGTGASPWSSIKNAGAPMELGLAETQQVLVMNNLRGRVKVRADGGIKTGRDVVFAALLGAEEYGFGTAAAVAVGCKMARQCHLNTCPVGVATQREDLRAKFKGAPEHVVHFFTFVAAEVREILASLGARSLDVIIGRQDLLEQVRFGEDSRTHMLDLSYLLADPDPDGEFPRRRMQPRNDRDEQPLDDTIVRDAAPAIEDGGAVRLDYSLGNQNRTVGARLAGELARRYGDGGLPHGTVRIDFEGSAGQSFGAFCVKGMHLALTGEANDYVAKGMSGGEVVVRPPESARFKGHRNVIIGNTCMYGATGGTLFAAGRAGERFAVRNSGGRAVVEGVGDHGCEYMTEGVVVILGETGRNFGAGMSNGVAYVFDEKREFPKNVNEELVGLEQVTRAADADLLRALLERHAEVTGSARAQAILSRWEHNLPLFWKVAPHLALTEEGPQTVVYRHLESIRMAAAGV